jgi:hypothetical protein
MWILTYIHNQCATWKPIVAILMGTEWDRRIFRIPYPTVRTEKSDSKEILSISGHRKRFHSKKKPRRIMSLLRAPVLGVLHLTHFLKCPDTDCDNLLLVQTSIRIVLSLLSTSVDHHHHHVAFYK